MKNLSAPIFLGIICVLFLMACASCSSMRILTTDECLNRLHSLMESKPVQTHLVTLDGQKVDLGEFFELSLMNSPYCALPEKFYHWDNEVKRITSKTEGGTVTHKIRIYNNYLTICRPDLADPKKTHGDIAEFYSENGEFMGLAVYSGDGFYCPLPYSKYRGASRQLRFWLQDKAVPAL